VAWTGDANNVLASWMHAAERFEFSAARRQPARAAAEEWLTDWVKGSGAAIRIGANPRRP
jgi:ornithine carbamoyltransferase